MRKFPQWLILFGITMATATGCASLQKSADSPASGLTTTEVSEAASSTATTKLASTEEEIHKRIEVRRKQLREETGHTRAAGLPAGTSELASTEEEIRNRIEERRKQLREETERTRAQESTQ